nr:MAG TPA: hypothetical protein [Bacteriophage sp.]
MKTISRIFGALDYPGRFLHYIQMDRPHHICQGWQNRQ